jgi:signal transduction histidine kinase/CheY-like chemotaxis protein
VTGSQQLDERVLVLAPSAHDGPVTAGILARAGFACVVVRDAAELCRAIEAGAGAVLVAEEALAPAAARQLADVLRRQEPWSDLPILLFSARGRRSGALASPTVETLAPFANVALLDRPVEVITLEFAVRAALRARRRQYAARAVVAELQAVLDAVPAAVFITRDRDARRISGNRHTHDLLLLAGGANLSKSAPPEERPTFRVMRDGVEVPPEELPVQRAAATGREIRGYEFDLVRDDGEVRHLVGNAAPLPGFDGAPAGAVGAFVDVTVQHRIQQQLRESDQRKTEFLGVLSHELRNPLAPIRNGVYLLARAPAGSDQARRAREVIQRQTEHLARLVDDLLDVTRISRGKVELQRARIDAREVVRRTCEDHRLLFEGRGIELRTQLSGPAWIDADATRIAQVIGNLLQNAAKFSRERGAVSVSVGAAGGCAEIRVFDEGAGIAPDLLPRLFQPFVQADGGTSRQHGGLGLGLALVKGLVELHGGTVRARSDGPDRGAEFVVRLPLVAAPGPAPEPTGLRARSSVHVLVIDDNVDAARTLADVLELEGHRVDVATDGRSGVAKARELVPNVVLCDIGLPDMTGYEVARILREDGALRATRLVALSGYAQPEDRARSVEAGFESHLVKPTTPEELRRALEPPGDAGARDGA